MKHGIWIQNKSSVEASDVVECAVAAEAAGWDGVFLSDSITWDYTDPWTLLAGIATRTDQIRLGTWITPIPRRQPWQLAYELATLDQLSDGRVILGGGLGTPSEHRTFQGSESSTNPAQRYDEALEIITGLWSGEPFSYEGDQFSVEEVELPQPPVQRPRIPIVLAGWWPNEAPFERAARWDGVMPYWPALTDDEEGPQGEQATGSIEEELRDMMEYYHSLTDTPGEIILPGDPTDAPDGYAETCAELGATWLLATNRFDPDQSDQNLERIRSGPPTP